jgi:hypothetical protein
VRPAEDHPLLREPRARAHQGHRKEESPPIL